MGMFILAYLLPYQNADTRQIEQAVYALDDDKS